MAGPATPRSTQARWLAFLYLAAGCLGLLNVIVPGYPGFNIPGLVVLSGWSLLWAGVLWVARERLAPWVAHAMLAQGTVLVCVAIHFTMGVPNAGSLFYLWIALYAFYFFPRRQAAAQLVLIGASYAVAIGLRPPPFPPGAHWATTVGTLTIAGFLVGTLKSRLDGRLAELTIAVAERDAALDRLRDLAGRDPLTGLPNRRAWTQKFAEEVVRAGRSRSPLSLALLDIDDFKAINDSQGHHAGDRLLRRLAGSWQQRLRESDFVARLGGDEFGVLLPDCDTVEAVTLLTRIRGADTEVPVSIGVVSWDGQESTAGLLERADNALYGAKSEGRDRIRVGRPGPVPGAAQPRPSATAT